MRATLDLYATGSYARPNAAARSVVQRADAAPDAFDSQHRADEVATRSAVATVRAALGR